MSRLNLSVLTAGLLLVLGCGSAAAQTPAKPAPAAKPTSPTPNANAGSKTLDGSAATSGKIMSINELQACLKRQDELKVRGTQLERDQADLNRERDEIQKQSDAVKMERDSIAKRNEAVRDYNNRMKAFSDQVDAWNKRMEAFNENTRSGPAVERERRELATEKALLAKTDAANKAEGAGLMDGLQEAVKTLNDHVDAQQRAATDWNERNSKITPLVRSYEDNRTDWREECGNRRYREEDEKALRSGK